MLTLAEVKQLALHDQLFRTEQKVTRSPTGDKVLTECKHLYEVVQVYKAQPSGSTILRLDYRHSIVPVDGKMLRARDDDARPDYCMSRRQLAGRLCWSSCKPSRLEELKL